MIAFLFFIALLSLSAIVSVGYLISFDAHKSTGQNSGAAEVASTNLYVGTVSDSVTDNGITLNLSGFTYDKNNNELQLHYIVKPQSKKLIQKASPLNFIKYSTLYVNNKPATVNTYQGYQSVSNGQYEGDLTFDFKNRLPTSLNLTFKTTQILQEKGSWVVHFSINLTTI